MRGKFIFYIAVELFRLYQMSGNNSFLCQYMEEVFFYFNQDVVSRSVRNINSKYAYYLTAFIDKLVKSAAAIKHNKIDVHLRESQHLLNVILSINKSC